MKIDLSGKTAIITGSTGGIGLAIARGVAACGATVIVNGRTQGAVAADLSTGPGCNALVEAEPACDILVSRKASRTC